MDRDYIIRIILEGRDMLSEKMRTAGRKFDDEVGKMRKGSKGLTDDLDDLADSSERVAEEWERTATAARDLDAILAKMRQGWRDLEANIDRVSQRSLIARQHLGGLRDAIRDAGAEARVADRDYNRLRNTLSRGAVSVHGLKQAFSSLLPSLSAFQRTMRQTLDHMTNFSPRMAFFATVLSTLVIVLGQLVTALVAVGAAAVVAAQALGGALVAAIGTLIPVAGLLLAVMNRLKAVFGAVGLAGKEAAAGSKSGADAAHAHAQAVDRLKDAQYNLNQAYIAQRDAVQRVQDAEKNLKEERRQAQRDLVDMANARIDAQLAERGATLSLLEAKQRLKNLEVGGAGGAALLRDRESALREAQARLDAARLRGSEGDIQSAILGVGVATQNLQGARLNAAGGDLERRRAQLDVDEAEQRKKEATITARRATEDNAKAQAAGVEGSDRYIGAKRGLIQANRDLARAEHNIVLQTRAVAEAMYDLKHATGGAASAASALDDALGKLSPNERKVFDAIQRLKKVWDQATRPLTDRIMGALAPALDRFATLFKDPALSKAFSNLADAMVSFVTAFSKFISSPEQKEFFAKFTQLAADILPTIESIFEKILGLAERIGLAFGPVLQQILGGVDKWLGKQIRRSDRPVGVERESGQQTALGDFALNSQKYLTGISRFFGSFFRMLGTLIDIASGVGLKALDSMSDSFDRLNKRMKDNPKQVADFLEASVAISGEILQLLGKVFAAFIKVSSTKQFEKFFDLLGTVGVGALENVLTIFGHLMSAIASFAKVPGMAKVLEALTTFFLAGKLIPGVGRASEALLLRIPGLNKLFGERPKGTPSDPIFTVSKEIGGPGGPGILGRVPGGGITMAGLRVAFLTFFTGGFATALGAAAGPAIAGLAAVVLGSAVVGAVIGDYLAQFVPKQLQIFNPEGKGPQHKAGRFLLHVALAPISTPVNLIKSFVNVLRGRFKDAGKNLADAFTLGYGEEVTGWFSRFGQWAWKHVLGPIAGWIGNIAAKGAGFLWKMGSKMAGAIFSGFNQLPGMLADVFTDLPSKLAGIANKFKDQFVSIGKGIGGWIASGLSGLGGWLKGIGAKALNVGKDLAGKGKDAAVGVGEGLVDLGNALVPKFAVGGQVPGSMGNAVPIIAHAGEWVLNAAQQARLLQLTGRSTGWIRDFLFGPAQGRESGDAGHRQRRIKAVSIMRGMKGYFGPIIEDWAANAEFGMSGSSEDAADQPVFIDTPLGQQAGIGRYEAARVVRSKGFWIPEGMKNVPGWANATRKQIMDWKRSNVMRGLGSHMGGFGDMGRPDKPFQQIMRSPLWSYGTGGVVSGFSPARVSMPHFAAGGVVTTPAVVGSGRAATGVNQSFQIATSNPNVDIDYVMRVARIHAEGSF